MIWTGSLYLYVHTFFFWLTMVDISTLGWLILWCSHRVRRTTVSEFESKPRGPVGLLPESICSDA